jgi:MFS superfamily sulfate permease-like transporter
MTPDQVTPVPVLAPNERKQRRPRRPAPPAYGGPAAAAPTSEPHAFDSSLKANWRSDVGAGLVVFLVALPLCLGVALASGAPLFSGIITGVLGGLVVSRLSGSQLMVSGPAAGLTAIVLAAITELGSFETFLVAVVLAGLMQIGLRFAKAGIIAYYFPSSVIKGMLAGIGLILILKQIPYALGLGIEPFEATEFSQPDGSTTFSAVSSAVRQVQFGALAISLLSLAMLVLWDRPAMKTVKRLLPGPLALVLVGVGLNALFHAAAPALAIPAAGLVNLPVPRDAADFLGQLAFPDFTQIGNPKVWTVAVTVALVASLETLLSLEATDKLDPQKRSSPANRELLAQGVGNTLAGLVGGLPMTGVIVRSAANIDSGGRTRWASFFHGSFLLVAVATIPRALNYIPLATLAAILLYTGYKLANPRVLRGAYRIGWSYLIPFVVTVAAILLTDLLIGIAVGVVVGTFFILRNNYRTPFFYHRDETADHKTVRIALSEDVSFLNKASILELLNELPEGATVTVDGSRSQHIDYDVLEILHDYETTAASRGITLRLVNVPGALAVASAH